ncbi:hypothetical protein [Nitrosococcus halophilus]|uniref:hypothetical protein n=1 Tax=Nitrosococcus halophilus TaxID=133539 RepID=UPI00059D69B3|nr:hypothetical protein [Nitrosococcus halophilus]
MISRLKAKENTLWASLMLSKGTSRKQPLKKSRSFMAVVSNTPRHISAVYGTPYRAKRLGIPRAYLASPQGVAGSEGDFGLTEYRDPKAVGQNTFSSPGVLAESALFLTQLEGFHAPTHRSL